MSSWSRQMTTAFHSPQFRVRYATPGTIGFHNVAEAAWNFHIGGYQVCEKWLNDQKGRKLLKADLEHSQTIVVALSETIRIMKKIDEVIERHVTATFHGPLLECGTPFLRARWAAGGGLIR